MATVKDIPKFELPKPCFYLYYWKPGNSRWNCHGSFRTHAAMQPYINRYVTDGWLYLVCERQVKLISN